MLNIKSFDWAWILVQNLCVFAFVHIERTWFHFLCSFRIYTYINNTYSYILLLFSLFICCLLTDPPSAPIISGYIEGSIIPAGSIQKLVCISSGGNPLATLFWFKNDKKVNFSCIQLICVHYGVLVCEQANAKLDALGSIPNTYVF